MSLLVLLDSGPLGLVTNPHEGDQALACRAWFAALIAAGHRALVPAITDYEVRRELIRAGKTNGLRALDRLKAATGVVSVTDEALLAAARLWAVARQMGLPTADKLALDADVILAAQALTLRPDDWGRPGATVIIATTNVGHLARYADARLWSDIG